MLFPSSYFSVQWISFQSHLNSLLCYSAAARHHTLPFLRNSIRLTSVAAHRIANQFPSLHHLAFPLRITVVLCFAIAILGNSLQCNSFLERHQTSLCPCISSLLRAYAQRLTSLPTLSHASLCPSYAFPRSARRFYSHASQLFATARHHRATLCHRQTALCNVSLCYSRAQQNISVPMLSDVPLCHFPTRHFCAHTPHCTSLPEQCTSFPMPLFASPGIF